MHPKEMQPWWQTLKIYPFLLSYYVVSTVHPPHRYVKKDSRGHENAKEGTKCQIESEKKESTNLHVAIILVAHNKQHGNLLAIKCRYPPSLDSHSETMKLIWVCCSSPGHQIN